MKTFTKSLPNKAGTIHIFVVGLPSYPVAKIPATIPHHRANEYADIIVKALNEAKPDALEAIDGLDEAIEIHRERYEEDIKRVEQLHLLSAFAVQASDDERMSALRVGCAAWVVNNAHLFPMNISMSPMPVTTLVTHPLDNQSELDEAIEALYGEANLQGLATGRMKVIIEAARNWQRYSQAHDWKKWFPDHDSLEQASMDANNDQMELANAREEIDRLRTAMPTDAALTPCRIVGFDTGDGKRLATIEVPPSTPLTIFDHLHVALSQSKEPVSQERVIEAINRVCCYIDADKPEFLSETNNPIHDLNLVRKFIIRAALQSPSSDVLEKVKAALDEIKSDADRAYCNALDIADRKCKGQEYKIKNNLFSEDDLSEHKRYAEKIGFHFGAYHALKLVRAALAELTQTGEQG